MYKLRESTTNWEGFFKSKIIFYVKSTLKHIEVVGKGFVWNYLIILLILALFIMEFNNIPLIYYLYLYIFHSEYTYNI